MISPFAAFHSASPSAVQPASAEPLKTTSGLNVGPAAFTVSTNTQQSSTAPDRRRDIGASISASRYGFPFERRRSRSEHESFQGHAACPASSDEAGFGPKPRSA